MPSSSSAAAPAPFSPQRSFLLDRDDVTAVALVRHGQQQRPASPVFDPEQWVDPPLSALGRHQADSVAAYLAEERVDVVACSQLSRAHETARTIAVRHGLDPVVFEELREVEAFRDGDARQAVSEATWRGAQERFVTERSWDVVPYGEGSAELRDRVTSVLEGLLALHPGKNLVVVCHGGVINAYLAQLLGIAQDMFFLPAHASVSRLRAVGAVRALDGLNERHHLRAAGPDLLTY